MLDFIKNLPDDTDQYLVDLERQLRTYGRATLSEGCFRRRIYLSGLRGTARDPIILDGRLSGTPDWLAPRSAPTYPGVIATERNFLEDREKFATWICGEYGSEEFRLIANANAKRREEGGHYPTNSEIADQAMITLVDCQHVIIRNMGFVDCWPTAIYMNNCQFITLDTLRFEGGTYCIGANGRNTHDLLIQNCRYRGDSNIWDHIDWKKIHGAADVIAPVNVDEDHRHLDGDFFRGWDIFGNVTIRDNWIGDCFNGIHFFTRHDGRNRRIKSKNHYADRDAYNESGPTNALDVKAAINVLIENNVFYRVRDNVFEPEAFAYNWVIRYNRVDRCYRPFSLQMKQAGWFYIYGNTGVLNDQPQGSQNSPSLFKLPKKQNLGGPIYVFQNSWFLLSRNLSRRLLRGLKHFNNAIEFQISRVEGVPDGVIAGGMLGRPPWPKLPPAPQVDPRAKKAFTRQWKDLDIEMDGDVSNDVLVLRDTGDKEQNAVLYANNDYALGCDTAYAKNVLLSSQDSRFRLSAEAKKVQAPVGFELALPNLDPPERGVVRPTFRVKASANCGALTTNNAPYDVFDNIEWPDGNAVYVDFPFLPDLPHESSLPKRADPMVS